MKERTKREENGESKLKGDCTSLERCVRWI